MTAAPPKQSHKKLKIALLGYRSHPFVGGQGIYLKYLSRALTAMGHKVDVFSGPPYPELDDDIAMIKVPSLDLFAHDNHVRALKLKHLKSFTDTFEWWSMLTGGFAEPYTFGRRVNKLLRDSDYDIIHDNQSLCHGLIDLQKRGKNVVSTIHHPIHRDRSLALDATEKWGDRALVKRWYSFLNMQENVVSRLKHVVTVSKASQQDIHTYFARPPEKTSVIPNGIDTELFCPQHDVQRERFRIITTASSDQPLKGLSFLLQAIAELKKTLPQIRLQIIGKLKEGGSTEKELQALGLSDSVDFASGISADALVTHYARASVAVCPSLYEGFGLPVGEAMACGLPVITSDGGALPEVIGEAGYVVKAGDAQALGRQIRHVFDHPEDAKAMGSKARQHIVEHFSWSKVATSLTDYYSRISSRANH